MNTFLVTGGNRGIGREIVRQLAQKGKHVILTSRNKNDGIETIEELNKEGLQNIVYHQLDVTSDESVESVKKFIQNTYPGGIDVLINNAGYASKGPAVNEKIARDTISVNYFGVKRVTLTLLPLIKHRIVTVSSTASLLDGYSEERKQKFRDENLTYDDLDNLAHKFIDDVAKNQHIQQGWPDSTYRVSKALVNTFTRILQRDLDKEGKNIVVNCCCPGYVKTRMSSYKGDKTPEEGAKLPVWLATAPMDEIKDKGKFFKDFCVYKWD